jgi:hypothetical protein
MLEFLSTVAEDEVARDRLAVTAQVYAGEQIHQGLDASIAANDRTAGNHNYTNAGGMLDLFGDAVGQAADDQAKGEAYTARLWGAAAKTGIEFAGGAAAAAPGPWAVPVSGAVDAGKSVLGFIIDEQVKAAEDAAQGRADMTYNDYVGEAQVSVQSLIADNLITQDGALDDPPRVPREFDTNGDGHLDMPPVGTPEHNDFVQWLNADSPDELPDSIPEGERQAELRRIRAMRNEMIEIYGTLDELVPQTR